MPRMERIGFMAKHRGSKTAGRTASTASREPCSCSATEPIAAHETSLPLGSSRCARAHRLAVASLLLATGCAIGPPVEWPDTRPIHAAAGFVVERVYGVPRVEQGSWISLGVEPGGRLIASDQEGRLYGITPAPVGAPLAESRVEPIEVAGADPSPGWAHGLLHAFGGLYVVRNEGLLRAGDNGLFRLRDAEGDGRYDSLERLREIEGHGEHGPHQLVVGPDGASLYFIAGNETTPTAFARSRVAAEPRDDRILPILPNWRILNLPPPGAWVARLDPDAGNWELIAAGMRNPYDLAFNRSGDLFVFDADMEWDIGTPWYRPTRVLHVRSGAEFGWRRGSGKWPDHYPDSLGAVLDVGTGSPTGVLFGYGAAFPQRYQEALYLLDWSQGKIHALHLTPRGSTYSGTLEPFVTGQPLPVTDAVIHPVDRALYFATGGRGAESGIYRVRYVGSEPTTDVLQEPFTSDAPNALHALRRSLETLHAPDLGPAATDRALPYLGHADRGIRYAARVALEHQPPSRWRSSVLAAAAVDARIQGALALARVGTLEDRDETLTVLLSMTHAALSTRQRLDWLRAIELWLSRYGQPDPAVERELIERLDELYPAGSFAENRLLAEILVFLEAPGTLGKTLALLRSAPTQEEQLHYGNVLGHVESGWSEQQRAVYFAWLQKARSFHGGMAIDHFVELIEDDARGHLSFADRLRYARPAPPEESDPGDRPVIRAEGPGRSWTLAEIAPLLEQPLRQRSHERGEAMFVAGGCFSCHRFAGRGGATGPDLTSVGSRFGPLEIAESVVEPSRVVSDQYQTVEVTLTDGEVLDGRIVNVMGNLLGFRLEGFVLNTDMATNQEHRLAPGDVEKIEPSAVSMMPPGLVNAMNDEELLDLLAYLVSAGDPEHPVFR